MLGDFRSGNSNETQDDGIAGIDRCFQKSKFVPHRIRKDDLENETLPLFHQLLPQTVGHARARVRVKAKFPGQQVGVDETQGGGLNMGVVESGFAPAIRSRERHEDRATVQQGKIHFPGFAWTG